MLLLAYEALNVFTQCLMPQYAPCPLKSKGSGYLLVPRIVKAPVVADHSQLDAVFD